MKPRSLSLPIALACTLALHSGLIQTACGQSTPVQQAIGSDVIVIGKILEIENELMMIEAPGRGKCAHTIASVQIEDPLLGTSGLTHIRVGSVSQQSQPNYRFRRLRSKPSARPLATGQEACFFLRKVPGIDVLVLLDGEPLDKGDADYSSKIACVRRIAGIIAKPGDALRSNDEDERQIAACVMVLRQRPDNGALGMEESKLVLQSLAEMKWSEFPFDTEGILSLSNVFPRLRLSEKDGWKAPVPKENDDPDVLMAAAVPKWLKEHAEKHRIKPVVARTSDRPN